MAVTPEEEKEILRLYGRLTKSPMKVANKVGVSVADVILTIEKNEEKLGPVPERNGGFGRAEIRPFLAARRRASESVWDNTLPEIATARAQYEEGTHIMATGRDGAYLLLYSIPRKGRPDPNKDYFLPEVA